MWVNAIYSTSILDKAIVGCFLADQATAAPQNIKVYPETNLQEFVSPAQSDDVIPYLVPMESHPEVLGSI